MPSERTNKYQELLRRLAVFRRRQKQLHFLTALFQWLVQTVPVWLLFILINGFLLWPSLYRGLALLAVIAFSLVQFCRIVFSPLSRILFQPNRPSLNQIALQVGEHYISLHDRLANALQLIRKMETNQEAYSETLIEMAFGQVADILEGYDFNEKLEKRRFSLFWKRFAAAAFLTLALFLIINSSFITGLERLLHPGRDYSIPAESLFTVLPGDARVLKGDDLMVAIVRKSNHLADVRLAVRRGAMTETMSSLNVGQDTIYYPFKAVRDSFQYQAFIGKSRTVWYRVSVLDRPLVRRLQVRLTPPAYSRQAMYLLPDNIGDITALKGTVAQLFAETNKSLAKAELVFDSGKRCELQIMNHNVQGTFAVQDMDRYALALLDKDGLTSDSQVQYHIRLIADQQPFVRITQPGRDVDLTEDMMLPLLIEAQDDYGLTSMQLHYQVQAASQNEIDSTRFTAQTIPGPYSEQMRVVFPWDLSASPLLPNESVLYFVDVHDNDTISGPKSAHTPIYRARFPSLYEMYDDLAQQHDNALDQAQALYEHSQEMNKNLNQLSQDMARDNQLDWQKKQRVEESVKEQQQAKENLDKLNQSLDEMVQKMERNNLVSFETLQKYQELQKLYQEIMTPELQKTMQKLAESLQNVDQEMLKKALQEFKLQAEEIEKNLDRTISLLKKLKMEQQLDRSIKMAEHLSREQKRVSEQADTSSVQKRLEAQQQIKENTKELKDLLKQMDQEMASQPTMPQQEVQNAMASLNEQNFNDQLQEMKALLQAGDSQQAEKQSAALQQQFDSVQKQLQQAKNKLSGQQQRKAMQALQRGMRDLLALSKKQEELLNKTERVPPTSAEMQTMAEEQLNMASGLQRVTEQMFSAAKESFQIDPKIGGALGQSAKSMQQSLAALEERNNGGAIGQQGQAMASLNRAALQMHQALQAMMQNGSGGGMSMEDFMQQMQAMSGAQQGINQQTAGMGMGGQMSLAQQAAMARLAAEQEAVRKSMEQMAAEAGQMSNILGSMDKMVDDMKKVEGDLHSQITRETIQRQQQILSRMLDAQKSMREREYSKKRKAETGKEYATISPKDLPADLGERREKWQQDVLRAKKEGYSRDYLDVIKQYFEALFERENTQP
jgi:hypothetical protein